EIQRGQSDVSPVERQRQGALTMTSQRTSPPWSGSGTGEYGRRPGGGASEASQKPPCGPGGRYGPRPLHFADRYIAEEAKPRTSPPAGGRGKVPPAERSEAEG